VDIDNIENIPIVDSDNTCISMLNDERPKNVRTAMESVDAQQWSRAIRTELKVLQENQTWTVVN
jgi:hypothetical protein